MNGQTLQYAASARSAPRSASKRGAPVYPDLAIATGPSSGSRTDAERLRDIAALARLAAAELAAVTRVTSRTDGAATLQALRQAAGDCSGYAETLESEAAA